MDRHLGSDVARNLPQEGAFAPAGLDQVDIRRAHDRQHHAGETGAAAKIDDVLRVVGNQGKKLRRVQHMAAPEIVEGRFADQIDSAVPLLQKRGVAFQPRQCFT